MKNAAELKKEVSAGVNRNRAEILRKYRWSFCGDEYFAATELLAAGTFRLLDEPKLLYVEFLGDTPRTFPTEDYTRLQETGCLWARKFTAKHAN